MASAAPPDPSDAPTWHHAALHELADLTMEIARTVQRQVIREAANVEQGGTNATPTGAGLLFTRIARTLRQIVALDARLAADHTAQSTGTTTERIRRAAAERARKRTARKDIRRRLIDAIEADATPRDTDALLRDLDDRLYDDDIDAALTVATITDIVLTLCAEHGIAPPLFQLTDDELGMDPWPKGKATGSPSADHPIDASTSTGPWVCSAPGPRQGQGTLDPMTKDRLPFVTTPADP